MPHIVCAADTRSACSSWVACLLVGQFCSLLTMNSCIV